MKGMPPGRKSIKTLCYTGEKRREVYAGMVRQIKAGHQAYIVCAVIEQGEMPGVHAAAEVYEEPTYLPVWRAAQHRSGAVHP